MSENTNNQPKTEAELKKEYELDINIPNLFTTRSVLEYPIDSIYQTFGENKMTPEQQEYVDKEWLKRLVTLTPFTSKIYNGYEAVKSKLTEGERFAKVKDDQYFALQNVAEFVRQQYQLDEESFNAAFENYMKNPSDKNFLRTLANYGLQNEKTKDTRYVMWIAEDDEARCKTCGEKNFMIFNIVNEPELAHPNCRCRKAYFGSVPKAKRYLVVIFSGINTKEGAGYMRALEQEIRTKLTNRTEGNTVDVVNIATYDDDMDNINPYITMGVDIAQVYSRIFNMYSRAPWSFANQVTNAYNSGEYDYVLFVGHSGGGVMATRVAETIDRIGRGPYVNRIVRIGSPELNVDAASYQYRTVDLINPGDIVPKLHFQIKATDQQAANIYMTDLVNLVSDDFFAPHLAYFQHKCDDFCREACKNIDGKPDVEEGDGEEEDGDGSQTNLNKTVQVILDNID